MLLPLIGKKINVVCHLGFATLVVGDGQIGAGGFFILPGSPSSLGKSWIWFQFGDCLRLPLPLAAKLYLVSLSGPV